MAGSFEVATRELVQTEFTKPIKKVEYTKAVVQREFTQEKRVVEFFEIKPCR